MKPPVEDLAQLSALLQVRGRALTYLAKHTCEEVNKHAIVTNKGKKTRIVYGPSPILKMAQTRLRERILLKLPVGECVHGFVPGRSLVTNARQHFNKGLVVNIDLKDFFPGIGVKRIFGLWRWIFEGDNRLAWITTSITSFDDHLCQGFVTSPDIANLIAWRLDLRAQALADEHGLTYTRYADDLTFSADTHEGDCSWIIKAVTTIAREEGFAVNPDKTAIMRKHRRQSVTGLIVNSGASDVRIPRYEKRRIRAMCHKGVHLQNPAIDAPHVEGWLAYMHSVDPIQAEKQRLDWETRISETSR